LSIFDCPFGFLTILPVALVCPFFIAPFVFSLSCQLLWFVHLWLPLWFSLYVASCSGLSIFDCPFGFLTMLPVALVCLFLIVPLVFSLCCQLLWFVHFWLPLWFSLYVTSWSCLSIFDCPFGFLSMLPIALVCPFLIASLVFSLCCQLLLFVHFWLPLWFFLYVTRCSYLSIFDCPFGFLTI
jgi:hypothetical protein